MDAIPMLQAAVALFAIAAAGGLVMAGIRLLGRHNPPAWLSMLHGLLAAAGVTLVAYAAAIGGVPTPGGWALFLFVVAAAGGAAMNLLWQWRQRPLPVGLMIGHAGIAVLAFVLLCVAAF
ncbi:MAG TPA: hypothetical protein VFT52_06310 [Luteimonas sp.]|jgi:hypothetical protein|nr:hypothetical protein [Luteimonas sp.]